jgi:hypothetical protein
LITFYSSSFRLHPIRRHLLLFEGQQHEEGEEIMAFGGRQTLLVRYFNALDIYSFFTPFTLGRVLASDFFPFFSPPEPI